MEALRNFRSEEDVQSVLQLPTGPTAGQQVEDFANALDDALARHIPPRERKSRMLGLPRVYYENTMRRLNQLRPVRGDDGDMDVDESEPIPQDKEAQIAELEKEAQIWDLLSRVLPLRYPDDLDPTARLERLADTGAESLMQQFLQTDPLAQERCAILQWLQHNASTGPDIDDLVEDLQQNADRGDIIAHGWLHTKSKIKLRKSMTAWPHLLDRQSQDVMKSHTSEGGAPLVTQLDPDAAARQNRGLEPKDVFFERATWLGCFEHLRRGSSKNAIRDWCQERTQMWRAMSMSAMLLSTEGNDASSDISPKSLALWRRMCYSLTKNGGTDDYERAVYGVLSGDIASVEKVAQTWDDFVFANYNALLRTQLDNYVLGQCTLQEAAGMQSTFPSFDAVQYLGQGADLEKRLMRSLESRRELQAQAREPHKALQSSFISGDLGRHFHEQGLVVRADPRAKEASMVLPQAGLFDKMPKTDKYFAAAHPDGMRIVVHAYLMVLTLERYSFSSASLDKFAPQEWVNSQESIVSAYVDYLRRAGLVDTVPLYCSLLGVERCYASLSENLIVEELPDRRRSLLQLVQKAGVNVPPFVRTMADIMYSKVLQATLQTATRPSVRIIEKGPLQPGLGRPIIADFFDPDEEGILDPFEHLVRSLEWLTLVEETWPSVLSMGTKAYKFFLKNMHLAAARLMIERVPFASIIQDVSRQESVDDAQLESIDFWTEQVEEAKIKDVTPAQVMADARNFRELEALVKALDSLETFGAMVEISPEVDYAKDRKFKDEMTKEIKATQGNMQPLLRQWLSAGIAEGDEELAEIRQMYLPETVLAYISALHYAGCRISRDYLLESMELASTIAQRDSDLSPTLQKGRRMRELVEALAACSKTLAISTSDKRGAGSAGSKKMREMGWSREVWSVKS